MQISGAWLSKCKNVSPMWIFPERDNVSGGKRGTTRQKKGWKIQKKKQEFMR